MVRNALLLVVFLVPFEASSQDVERYYADSVVGLTVYEKNLPNASGDSIRFPNIMHRHIFVNCWKKNATTVYFKTTSGEIEYEQPLDENFRSNREGCKDCYFLKVENLKRGAYYVEFWDDAGIILVSRFVKK